MNELQTIGTIGGLIVTFVAALNRHGIAKHIKRVFGSFRKTVELVKENEMLTERLTDAEERNVQWEAALDNCESLRRELGRQLDQQRVEFDRQLDKLREIIDTTRKQLGMKDDLIHLLQCDRDALLTWGRLSIGQLHASGIKPDYPAPSLRSVVAVPVPEGFLPYIDSQNAEGKHDV